jgi:hypothetical protein
MMENNGLSDTKQWLQGLVQAAEAAIAAAENCPAVSDPESEVAMLVTSQRDLVRSEVVRFRATLSFDRRYWKQGTFVYPMHVFLDPEHKFSAQHIQQIQALKIGETIDLADGRTVQRQQ